MEIKVMDQVANYKFFTSDRQKIASQANTYLFVPQYLPHYAILKSAPFHWELAQALDDKENDLIEIIGFRDSAKSTYATLAYPLRVMLAGEYKFIVIINDTQKQVELAIANLKAEIENNEYIKRDFSHIKIGKTWSSDMLVLSNGVRVMGASRGQNIRGIKHRESRPDLIIIDDPENLRQVKKKTSRDATMAWFNAEVLPARSAFGAKLIVIGNMLHNDGFIARLSKNDLFKVIRLPALDTDGIPLWLAKYPTRSAIDRKIKEVGITAWSREYMLKVISEEDQIIKETDIAYYDNKLLSSVDDFGNPILKILRATVGGDLAISEKQTADFTVFQPLYETVLDKRKHFLVIPSFVKGRFDFATTQIKAVELGKRLPYGTLWYLEDVGYQRAAIQELGKKIVGVLPIKAVADKHARLESVSPYIKDGTVLFPMTGCEELINSLINFGSEEHDDDVDALVYAIMGMINKSATTGVVSKSNKI